MPRREAKFAVNASPTEVWRFVRDFESLCTCIPGVERIRVLDDRSAELTVKEKIGVVPMLVELRAQVECEEPPRRLHAMAKAEHLTMGIDVELKPSGTGTILHSVFDVTGSGPLKPVVDRLFEKRATERSAQFAQCLGKRFGALGALSSEVPAPSSGPARHRIEVIRLWLERLWRRTTRFTS